MIAFQEFFFQEFKLSGVKIFRLLHFRSFSFRSLSFRSLSSRTLSFRSLSFRNCLSRVCLLVVCLSGVCLSGIVFQEFVFYEFVFLEFQNLMKFEFCWRPIFFDLIIHKPSLGSGEVLQKMWAGSVQPFWILSNTNKQANTQTSKVHIKIDIFCSPLNLFTVELEIN